MKLNLIFNSLIIIFILCNHSALANQPDCNFSTNINKGILPLNISITDETQGIIEQRTWFIDGNKLTDTSKIVNYTFFTPGWHSIKLRVNTDNYLDSLKIENAVYAGFKIPSFLEKEELISKPFFKKCHPIKYWENASRELLLCSYCYNNQFDPTNIFFRKTDLHFNYRYEVLTDKLKTNILEKYCIVESSNEGEFLLVNSTGQGYVVNIGNNSYDFFEFDYNFFLEPINEPYYNDYRISEIIKHNDHELVFFIYNTTTSYLHKAYYIITDLNLNFKEINTINNFGKVKDKKLKENGNFIFLNTLEIDKIFVQNIIVELDYEFTQFNRAYIDPAIIDNFELVSDNEIVYVECDKNGDFRITFYDYESDEKSSYPLLSNISVNAIKKIKNGLFVAVGEIDNYMGFFIFNKDFSFKKEFILENRKGKLTDLFITSDNCIALIGFVNHSTDKTYTYSAKTQDIGVLLGTKVTDKKYNNDISIVPNPANHYFLIKSKNRFNQISGAIYDLRGQHLMSFDNQYKIYVNNLQAGLYIVKIRIADEVDFLKLHISK